jgi:anti-sigma B factor antagonist
MKSSIAIRTIGDVTFVDLKGKITIGVGDLQMREGIRQVLASGAEKIVVNMKDVTTIDSTGVGELVGCYNAAMNRGAKLKLMCLPSKISDVLTVTQLITVFDVYNTEAEAIASF